MRLSFTTRAFENYFVGVLIVHALATSYFLCVVSWNNIVGLYSRLCEGKWHLYQSRNSERL